MGVNLMKIQELYRILLEFLHGIEQPLVGQAFYLRQ